MNDFRITEQTARAVHAKARMPHGLQPLPVLLAGAVLLFVSRAAFAQQADQPAIPQIGESTAEWVQLQASGKQAAEPIPMLGEEATLAYRRYMDSFNSKIPLFFQSSLQTQPGSGQAGGAN